MFAEKEKDTEVKYVSIADAEILDKATKSLEAKWTKESQKNKNFIEVSRGLRKKGPLKNSEEFTGKSRTTIFRTISCSYENRLIALGKFGNTKVYILNPEIACATSRDRKNFVNFKDNTLIENT